MSRTGKCHLQCQSRSSYLQSIFRGVASVAIRSLAIAAESLNSRREQEEVLQIFEKIRQETGWRVGFVNDELKEKWHWAEDPPPPPAPEIPPPNILPSLPLVPTYTYPPAPPPPPVPVLPPTPPTRPTRPTIPAGILNPLLATADFSMPQHPYKSHYVAPRLPSSQPQYPY